MEVKDIARLAAEQGEKQSLDQAFYTDPDIYREDMERIFMNSWLYAGHVSEIPNVGDWFLYELDSESVIIIRCAEDRVNALLKGKGHVSVADIRDAARPALRHRIGLTFDAEAEGLSADALIKRVLSEVPEVEGRVARELNA